MNKSLKTIDIQAKEWFDKVNGNSYFAGIITTNFGQDDEQTFKMPFQYGYESAYEQAAVKLLQESGILPGDKFLSISRYCRENNIELRSSLQRNCKQRELKALTA